MTEQDPKETQESAPTKVKPILTIGVGSDGKLTVETSEENMRNKKILFTIIGEAIKIIANTPEPGVIIQSGDNRGFRGRLGNFLKGK